MYGSSILKMALPILRTLIEDSEYMLYIEGPFACIVCICMYLFVFVCSATGIYTRACIFKDRCNCEIYCVILRTLSCS